MATLAEAAYLALEKKFSEAADVALEAAHSVDKRQPVSKAAYETYAAAGKFYQMAGNPLAAMAAFDHCFEIFDRIILAQANLNFVITHLTIWPELFARAALAALDDGQPMRAIDYAETGRARLTGNMINQLSRPGNADKRSWDEYASLWRNLASCLTNNLYKGQKSGKTERELIEKLKRARKGLIDSGVERKALLPVSDVVVTEQLIKQLSDSGLPPTVLVYVISLDEEIFRPVLVSEKGAFEINLTKQEQKQILTSAHRFNQRITGNNGYAQLEDALDELMENCGPELRMLFRQIGKDHKNKRIYWIPHGELVTVPISAIPMDNENKVLGDEHAIQVAPSLAMASRSIGAHLKRIVKTSVYIEGRVESGKAETGGGVSLLTPVAKEVKKYKPKDCHALSTALASADLALFSCHGVFDWRDPLDGFIELGFDFKIKDLLEQKYFPDTLVVLNTCDAGTVAQDETNEPVGIPIAMLASGAQTVIGPSQPIASIAGVSFCYFFFKSLANGFASPEAVQESIKQLRRISRSTLSECLAEAGHPFAGRISKYNSDQPAFNKRCYWAFFQHWGGDWRT